MCQSDLLSAHTIIQHHQIISRLLVVGWQTKELQDYSNRALNYHPGEGYAHLKNPIRSPELFGKFVRPHNNPVSTTWSTCCPQNRIQYLHFQFYVLCFGKHHRFIFASCLFINAGHVTCMLAAPFNIAQQHTGRRGRVVVRRRQATMMVVHTFRRQLSTINSIFTST